MNKIISILITGILICGCSKGVNTSPKTTTEDSHGEVTATEATTEATTEADTETAATSNDASGGAENSTTEIEIKNDLNDFRCEKSDWKRVFITSNVFTGAEVYDVESICRRTAVDSGILVDDGNPDENTVKGWIGWNALGPNQTFVKSSCPYYVFNGFEEIIIADDYDDLTDGNLKHAISFDEYENEVFGSVWTNVDLNGNSLMMNANCDGWYSNFGIGIVGQNDTIDSIWTNSEFRMCNGAYHIYCFEQ